MQIRSAMTSYCLLLKMIKYWINDISGNIKAVFLKLGSINVHHKRNTMTPLATGAVLIKTKIPSFVVNQEPSTPHNLMTGVKTIWELRLFQVAPFVALFSGVANGDICFLDRKRLEPKELLWQHHWGCHFISFVMHIYGAKFQEYCFNISRDIVYSVFYHF